MLTDKKDKVHVHLSMDPDLLKKLDAMAGFYRRSRTGMVEQLVSGAPDHGNLSRAPSPFGPEAFAVSHGIPAAEGVVESAASGQDLADMGEDFEERTVEYDDQQY